jgi:poly-gamma-glutamate system protein
MKSTGNKEFFLLINALIGICLMVAISLIFTTSAKSGALELREAAENMEQSLTIIKNYCVQNQINTNNPEDFRHTGMIGPEWSELTTTVGDPEAKRTTINPNFAALIVHLLNEAGVKKGDTIAISSSASFPALLIASLSAAKALDLQPLVMISLGSSSFGASNPKFTLWDMYRLLLNNHIIDFQPVAVSFGGEDDTGSEFDPDLSNRLRKSIQEAGIPMISESDLQKNRLIRENLFFGGNPHRIKAFINTGGSYANMGSSQSVLNIKPGLVRKAVIPVPAKQGLIHAMLQKRVPVIHLLFIKGLTRKYNLPWDPASEPEITQQSVQFDHSHSPAILILSLTGLLWFFLVLIRYRMLYNSAK